jgi:hypothetical protein
MSKRLGRLQRQSRRAFWASAGPEVFTSELAGWCWARQTLNEKRAPSRWQRESMIRAARSATPHRFVAAAPAQKGRLLRSAVGALTRSSRRETCAADHLPPRAAGMPRASNSAAMARNDSQPAACSSFTVSARCARKPASHPPCHPMRL